MSFTQRAPVLGALGLLALTAAACATAPIPPTNLAGGGGAPVPVAGYDWFLHQDGEAARLVFGLEESDDLKLALDCERGKGRLELSALAPKGAKPEIYLEAGGETERFAAVSEPSQLDDGLFLTAEASPKTPVFQRFAQTGWMALWRGDERQMMAGHPGADDRARRFLAFCG